MIVPPSGKFDPELLILVKHKCSHEPKVSLPSKGKLHAICKPYCTI